MIGKWRQHNNIKTLQFKNELNMIKKLMSLWIQMNIDCVIAIVE